MRSSKKPLLFFLLLPVLLAVAWLGLDLMGGNGDGTNGDEIADIDPGESLQGEDPNAGAEDPPPVPLVNDPRAQVNQASTGTTVEHPLEIELTLIQAGTAQKVQGELPKGSGADARIRGRITNSMGQGCEATVQILHGPNSGRRFTCNADGEFGSDDLYAGRAVIEVRTPTGLRARRDVILRRLSEQILRVNFAGPATVIGTVVDDKNEPMLGAEVTVDGNVAFTDQAGRFRLPRVASGRDVIVTIDATGYARFRQQIHLERASVVTDDHFKFKLEKEATLQVSVPNAAGVFQDVLIYLYPTGGSSAAYDFPWELVSPVRVKPGSQTTIKGLRRGSFTAVAYHSGAIANPRQQTVRVENTRANLLEVNLTAGPTLTGSVMRDGVPVAGAIVEMEAPDLATATTKSLGRGARYVEEMLLPHVPAARQETRTDAHGNFTLTAYGDQGKLRYVSARTPDGTWVGNATVRIGDGKFTIDVQAVAEKVGAMNIKLAERWQGLPVEVRRAGKPEDPFLLEAGEDLLIDGLAEGMWRVSANWRGSRVIELQGVEIIDGESTDVMGRLPKPAIDGT